MTFVIIFGFHCFLAVSKWRPRNVQIALMDCASCAGCRARGVLWWPNFMKVLFSSSIKVCCLFLEHYMHGSAAEGCCFTMAGLPPGFAVTLVDVWQHLSPWLHPGVTLPDARYCPWHTLRPFGFMHSDSFKLWKLQAEGFAELRALSRTGNWISVHWFRYYTLRRECIRCLVTDEESAREALEGFRMSDSFPIPDAGDSDALDGPFWHQ